ncbi:hypothetical protein PMAYCL1PPCAC_07136, partial [Pristionchus mayeri]
LFSLLSRSICSQDEEIAIDMNGPEMDGEWTNDWMWTTVSPPPSTHSATHPTLIITSPSENQNRSATEDPCRDTLPNCAERKQLCEKVLYGPLVTQFCAKTCGRCKEFTRLTRDQKCRDNDQRCATLVQLGFCFSNHNETTKVKYCARSCGLCDAVEV